MEQYHELLQHKKCVKQEGSINTFLGGRIKKTYKRSAAPVNTIGMEENQNIGSKLLCKHEIYYSPQLLNGIDFVKR